MFEMDDSDSSFDAKGANLLEVANGDRSLR